MHFGATTAPSPSPRARRCTKQLTAFLPHSLPGGNQRPARSPPVPQPAAPRWVWGWGCGLRAPGPAPPRSVPPVPRGRPRTYRARLPAPGSGGSGPAPGGLRGGAAAGRARPRCQGPEEAGGASALRSRASRARCRGSRAGSEASPPSPWPSLGPADPGRLVGWGRGRTLGYHRVTGL